MGRPPTRKAMPPPPPPAKPNVDRSVLMEPNGKVPQGLQLVAVPKRALVTEALADPQTGPITGGSRGGGCPNTHEPTALHDALIILRYASGG